MHLDLVDGRNNGRFRDEAVQVFRHKVAHADGAYVAVGEGRY
jgi:hypothetical protein